MFVRGVVSGGSVWFAAAAPSTYEIPKKLSLEKYVKSEFHEKWGKIGRLPPNFWSLRRPWCLYIDTFLWMSKNTLGYWPSFFVFI